jgi:hypothetical protein
MFTQNRPVGAIRGQLVDERPGSTTTSGGSSESDEND